MEFARAFYARFLAGVPFAESVRRARLAIRDAFPGDPTWLAYAAFAHPLAAVAADASSPPVDLPPPIPSDVGASPRACPPRVVRRGDPTQRRRRLAWITAAVVLGLVTFPALHLVKTPTRVRFDLELSRLDLTVAGPDPPPLTALAFDHLTLSRFSRVELHPSKLEALEEGLWKDVPFSTPLRIDSSGAAQITLTSTNPAVQSPIGSIGRLRLRDRDRVELRQARLTALDVDWKTGHLHTVIDGIAGEIRVGPRGLTKDHRLSLYQKLVAGRLWAWLTSWIAGCLSAAVALEKLLKPGS
jgi:hypothetical protein